MRIPSSVNILGRDCQVIIRNFDSDDDFEKNCQAYFCQTTNTIHINSKLKGKNLQITFLHEISHAFLYRAGLTVTSLSQDVEEVIAEQLANFIHETFDIKLKKSKKKS
jgi:Zn-dependent peptidase ImmA (M78 family)